MPKAYVAMRDKFVAQGMDYDKAQTKAAKIYNSNNPDRPMGSKEDRRDMPHHRRMKGKRRKK